MLPVQSAARGKDHGLGVRDGAVLNGDLEGRDGRERDETKESAGGRRM